MNKNIMLAGLILMLAGLFLTGAFHKLISGDTTEYLKYFGGIIGTVLGVTLLQTGIKK